MSYLYEHREQLGENKRLAATLTCCMKPLVSWVLTSATSALSSIFWDTLATVYIEVSLLPHQELIPPHQTVLF